ncbi:MAG: hypothetical protein IJ209_02740 [Bacteroidaceae bacterium]|nr:hypothetical protein [Bacteroidaceae bacterium]
MKKIIIIIAAAALLLPSCKGGLMGAFSGADSTSVADSDSLAPRVLTSVFGHIPGIYEAEMRAITEQARAEAGNNADNIRGIMANLADSAYQVAEEKAMSEIVSMQGGIIRCTADEGLPYKVAPEASVLTVLLPKLQNVGGEERVFLQMEFTPDSVASKAYYVLTGSEGKIATGTIALPLTKEPTKVTAVIVAPNAPAKYLEACSEIHFTDQKTYTKLREFVKDRQKIWRATYAKELGIEIEED